MFCVDLQLSLYVALGVGVSLNTLVCCRMNVGERWHLSGSVCEVDSYMLQTGSLVWAGSYACWFGLVPMLVGLGWFLCCWFGLVPMLLVWAGSYVVGLGWFLCLLVSAGSYVC